MFKEVLKNEKPLAERVANKIVQLIIDKNLIVGEKLPNEFELAESLGVGRGTVREAVKLLVSRNILEIQRGKGTFVSQKPGVVDDPLGLVFFKDKQKLSLDLLEIRFMLEPKIAALAAENATEEDINEMKRICDEIEQYVNSTGEYSIDLDLELHICIAKSTGNLVIPKLIPIIQTAVEVFKRVNYNERGQELILSHRELVNAIEAHDSELVESLMKKHLDSAKRDLEALEDESK